MNLPDYPINFIIETSTFCNLKCVMCTHSAEEFPRKKIQFPLELVNKLTPYIANAKHMQLHGIGEPLLSESFWEILKLIPFDCRAEVNTNFTVVTNDMIDTLLNSNLKSISISIDSPDEKIYYRIRGYVLDNVIQNIKMLIQKKNIVRPTFTVSLNMTLMKENIELIPKALDLANSLGCNALFTWPMNRISGNTVDLNRNLREWEFNYNEQCPWSFVELYNKKIDEAMDYAKKIHFYFSGNKI